jgi:hypothetical protein
LLAVPVVRGAVFRERHTVEALPFVRITGTQELRSREMTKNTDLKNRLARLREIELSVIGRKSGRTISIPVWFALEGEKLYLLPVQGSETQWYKNVRKNPSIRIDTREFRAVPITEAKVVKSVIEKFRAKYSAEDVKKYYSGFDVAVVIDVR